MLVERNKVIESVFVIESFQFDNFDVTGQCPDRTSEWLERFEIESGCKVPEVDIDLNEDTYARINCSETYTVNAFLLLDLLLSERVHTPWIFTRPIPCQISVNLRVVAHDEELNLKQIASEEFKLLCLLESYDMERYLNLTFSIDTGEFPTGIKFIVDYFLYIPTFYGIQVNHERATANAIFNLIWSCN